MKASKARTLALLSLTALLAVLTALVIWRPGLEDGRQDSVTGLDPASIQRLAVDGPKASPVTLERENEQWLLVEPARLPADSTQLLDLLAVAGAVSRARYDLTELDLEATGLEQPDVTLRVDQLVLEFGARAPVSGDRYVRVGDQVHLLADVHYHTLTQPLSAYVAPALFAADSSLQAVRLPDLALQRNAEDRWEFQGAPALIVDAQEIGEAWETAVAAAVQPYSQTTEARGRVELLLAEGPATLEFDVLEIPGKADFILGRRDLGLQYHFAPETGRRLLGKAAAPAREP